MSPAPPPLFCPLTSPKVATVITPSRTAFDPDSLSKKRLLSPAAEGEDTAKINKKQKEQDRSPSLSLTPLGSESPHPGPDRPELADSEIGTNVQKLPTPSPEGGAKAGPGAAASMSSDEEEFVFDSDDGFGQDYRELPGHSAWRCERGI